MLVGFETVLQIFFELTIRQDFLEAAPGGFATFWRSRLRTDPTVDFVEDALVVGTVFRFGQELFVDIEAFVIPFGHRFFRQKD